MSNDALECVVRRADLVSALQAMKPLIERKKESPQRALKVVLDETYLALFAGQELGSSLRLWSRLRLPVEYQAGPGDIELALSPEDAAMIIGAYKDDPEAVNLWVRASRSRLAIRALGQDGREPSSVLEMELTPPAKSFNDVAGMLGAVARSRPMAAADHVTVISGLAPVVAAAKRVSATVTIEVLEGIQGRHRSAVVFAGPVTCVIEGAFESQATAVRDLAASTPSMPRWGSIREDVERDIAAAISAAAKAAEGKS